MINIPKGTKDMLPQEAYKWHYVENIAREVAACFGFKEIRTPMFEHTELFLRGVGETTDIVTKEMYTFDDKGQKYDSSPRRHGGRCALLYRKRIASRRYAYESVLYRKHFPL